MATHSAGAAASAGAVLYVKSLDIMSAFYRGVFGATVSDRAHNYVALELPGFRLLLHGMPPHIADAIVITQPPVRREEAATKLSLPVVSLQDARRRAHDLGGTLEPQEREWEWLGRRYCDASDPEGNVVQCHEAGTTTPTGS